MKALLRRAAALAALLSIVGRRPVRAALLCPAALDMSKQIDPKAILHYAVVAPSDPPGAGNGLFCARLEVDHGAPEVDDGRGHDPFSANGWVGLTLGEKGFTGGNPIPPGLPGSTSIVGLDGDVRKYEFYAYCTPPPGRALTACYAGVEEMGEEKQTLTNTSIVKGENGTIMSFAKLLEEEGEVKIANGTNYLLHARGGRDLVGIDGPGSIGLPWTSELFPFSLELELPVDDEVTNATEPGSGSPVDDIVDAPTPAPDGSSKEPSSAAAMVAISVVSGVFGAILASLNCV